MKTLAFFLPVILAASEAPVDRLFDAKLTTAQRATACFELRGKIDPRVIVALGRALEDPELLSCAAENLRIAGAIEPLTQALVSQNFQVRAAAARELGKFDRPELLEPLSRAARDENTLVAINALNGLSQYQDAAAVPYLAALASEGGMTGDMALELVWQRDPARAVTIARGLLRSAQVPDQLYAMRVLGASGDATDLPQLRKIATAHQEILVQRDRGFGLMPAINLSRAALSAIAAIESR